MTNPEVSSRVEALVDALVRAGCEMYAIGSGYCLNEPLVEPFATAIRQILATFGPRDDLMAEINACLRKRGRYVDP
jgi:sialic acid synthase SpsE